MTPRRIRGEAFFSRWEDTFRRASAWIVQERDGLMQV